MRCPFCGAFNRDNATYCTHCGRDLNHIAPPARSPQPPQPQRPPYQQPQRPAYMPPQRPAQTPPQRPQQTPAQRPQSVQPATTTAPNHQRRRSGASAPAQPEQPLIAPVVPEPEPPAPFPPHTMEQLQALLAGAQNYELLSDDPREGRKRLVRISYPPCANWQQVATLFKALHEYRSEKFASVIIQGNRFGTNDPYNYNNGQLVFDRRVLLGSDMLNRYQIDTGTGLDITSVRIVLSEKC